MDIYQAFFIKSTPNGLIIPLYGKKKHYLLLRWLLGVRGYNEYGHPERNEGSRGCSAVPHNGDPSLRSG